MLTPEQDAEIWRRSQEGETYVAIAKAVGVTRHAVSRSLGRSARKGLHLSDGLREATRAAGGNCGEIVQAWSRVKDADGNKVTVHLKAPKPSQDTEAVASAIADALASCPQPKPVTHERSGDNDLEVAFVVTDLHVGMYAAHGETGEVWNRDKLKDVYRTAFDRLVSVSPSANTAIVAQLGDLMHNDDQRNVTPQSGHQLDVDGRYFEILKTAVELMKWTIERLRQKYPNVVYRGCRGNHDMNSHHAVNLALFEHYRDVEGVTIDEATSDFYVRQFGQNMLVLSHGDKVKPQQMPGFSAAQWPKVWGNTAYRYALTGHVHHESRKDFGGMVVESFETLIPRDAHAFQSGYNSRRSLVALTLHRDFGELGRNRSPIC